jgi:signal peptide peptidase SppA
MKLTRVIDALENQPWLIVPSAHDGIRRLVQLKLSGGLAQRDGTDICGEAVEVEQMQIREDGIAVIPVGGVLGRKLSSIERGMGAVDYGDIEKEMDEAEANDAVRGIVLVFDSPGGMYGGLPEASDRIMNCTKPTLAWVPGMACSAAMWMAASCDQIVASPSAILGSIGVYVPWIDQSRAFENAGLKSDPITSGEYKAAGFPGTSLTDSQRDDIQARVDSMAEEFKELMRFMRGVDDEYMEGQVFSASDAKLIGLADGIANTIESAISGFIP